MTKANSVVIQSNKIIIYKATMDDIDWVVATEQDEENAFFVYQWTKKQHLAALKNKNICHYIVRNDKEERLGYIILDDVINDSNSINLRRLVICEKGHGNGRETVKLVKTIAFKHLKANRLWIDVFVDNEVALSLYQSLGFTTEGTLRESYKRNNKYVSQVIMSFLANEYVEDFF